MTTVKKTVDGFKGTRDAEGLFHRDYSNEPVTMTSADLMHLMEAIADISYHAGFIKHQQKPGVHDSRAQVARYIELAQSFCANEKGLEQNEDYIERIDAFATLMLEGK